MGLRDEMSRGFIASLAGIAMTLFAWYGPWAWPAAPAFAVIRIAFGTDSNFADLPYAEKSTVVVLLILVNVGAWAAGVRAVMVAWDRVAPKVPSRSVNQA
jgi:hypothetical protein